MLLMGKSTISMVIFNSKLLVYQRVTYKDDFHGIMGFSHRYGDVTDKFYGWSGWWWLDSVTGTMEFWMTFQKQLGLMDYSCLIDFNGF